MSMNNIRARYETLKTLGFAAIGAGYTGIQDMAGNPVSSDHEIRIYTILNRTDADLLFSLDGINPFILIPNGQSYTEDLSSNQALSAGFALPAGTRLYIAHNGVAPTSGSVYWTICYGSSN